jgi:nucleoside-diphosphate-sugar epimerase
MLEIIYKDADKTINSIDFSKLANKKILITGASGLIGLHSVATLVQLKKKKDLEIFCWVNSKLDKKISNLFETCNVIFGNLTDAKTIAEVNEKFDVIIHAAGYAQPQKFTGDKLNTIKLNTETTNNLFNLLKPNGTFVFCSTSEIYSGLVKENITEEEIGTTTPDHPRSCYIESKRCGETICHAYKDKGFDVKIARISLAYGPGTRINDSRVMHSIIQKGLEQGEITLLDSGMSMRTYGYVMDLVKMIFNITLHGKNTVYNVCGDSKILISELASKISNKLNCSLSIPKDDKNALSGNPKAVNLSLKRYTNEFGKPQFIKIEEGIEKTISWQKYICDKQ